MLEFLTIHALEMVMTQNMRSRSGRKALRCLMAATLVACGSSAGWAGRLDKATCATLSDEYVEAAHSGIQDDLSRGPAWGKANLKPDRLSAIMRFIDVEQQLEFRCGRGAIAKLRERLKSPAQAEQPNTATAGESQAKVTPPVTPGPAAPGAEPLAPATAKNVPGEPAKDAPVPPAAPDSVPAAKKSEARPAEAAPVRTAPPAKVIIKPPIAPAAPSLQKQAVPAQPQAPVAVKAASPPAAKTPPAGKAALAPVRPEVTDTTAAIGPAVAAPAAKAPLSAPQLAPAPIAPKAKEAATQGDAAEPVPGRKKRRTPSNAYVSPSDVAPFSIPGFNSR